MSKCNTVKTVSVLSGSSLVIRTKAVKKITHVSNDFFFFFKKPINNYSSNKWHAEHFKSKLSGAALTVYSSHHHH